MKGKKLDLLVVVVLNACTGLFAYATKDMYIGKMFFAGMLTQLLPIIYLSFRKKKQWKKLIIAVLVFDLLFESFDFIAEYTQTWTVASVVLPKIFNVLPLDNIITHQAIVLYTLVFYQHFFEDKKKDRVSQNIFIPATLAFLTVVLTFGLYPHNIVFFQSLQYPFLYLGTLAVIPTLFLYIKHPRLLKTVIPAGIYFFFYYFITELLAGRNGYWIYKGDNYIGWMTFFGITFPVEEFVFWVVLYGPTIIAYYKFWIDQNS